MKIEDTKEDIIRFKGREVPRDVPICYGIMSDEIKTKK